MKLPDAADWQGKVNRAFASAAEAKVTCRSLLSVSIHKSATARTKDQKAFRHSDMALKLELIAL